MFQQSVFSSYVHLFLCTQLLYPYEFKRIWVTVWTFDHGNLRKSNLQSRICFFLSALVICSFIFIKCIIVYNTKKFKVLFLLKQHVNSPSSNPLLLILYEIRMNHINLFLRRYVVSTGR